MNLGEEGEEEEAYVVKEGFSRVRASLYVLSPLDTHIISTIALPWLT